MNNIHHILRGDGDPWFEPAYVAWSDASPAFPFRAQFVRHFYRGRIPGGHFSPFNITHDVHTNSLSIQYEEMEDTHCFRLVGVLPANNPQLSIWYLNIVLNIYKEMLSVSPISTDSTRAHDELTLYVGQAIRIASALARKNDPRFSCFVVLRDNVRLFVASKLRPSGRAEFIISDETYPYGNFPLNAVSRGFFRGPYENRSVIGMADNRGNPFDTALFSSRERRQGYVTGVFANTGNEHALQTNARVNQPSVTQQRGPIEHELRDYQRIFETEEEPAPISRAAPFGIASIGDTTVTTDRRVQQYLDQSPSYADAPQPVRTPENTPAKKRVTTKLVDDIREVLTEMLRVQTSITAEGDGFRVSTELFLGDDMISGSSDFFEFDND